jgi:hypothetical protein
VQVKTVQKAGWGRNSEVTLYGVQHATQGKMRLSQPNTRTLAASKPHLLLQAGHELLAVDNNG